MGWRGLKPVVLVELSGLLVKGMHEQGSDARVLRYGHRAIDRVLKQGCALRSTASRARTMTGTGSGMLRRTPLVASWCKTAPAAIA